MIPLSHEPTRPPQRQATRRVSHVLAGAAAATLLVLLAGCSQKPQTLTQTGAPASQDPWMGAKPAFTEKDWTVGDKASWQREINRRAQNQNEYVRMR